MFRICRRAASPEFLTVLQLRKGDTSDPALLPVSDASCSHAANSWRSDSDLMQRLVQVNSQEVDAWIARARFRVQINQAEAAGQDIKRALDIATNEFAVLHAAGSGNLPETFLHLAFVQAEPGNAASARQTLAHAFEVGLRAEQLHPLDRDLLNRLNAQFQIDSVAADRTYFDL